MSDSMPQLLIESMQKLLEDDYCEAIKAEGSFAIEEKAADMKIDITRVPKNGLKILVPSGAHTKMVAETIEGKSSGYKRSCDCLVLEPRASGVLDVYFIELKKTLHQGNDSVLQEAFKQILSTIPIWDYLVSMVYIHLAKKSKIKKNFIEKNFINKHFVVIAKEGTERIDKRGASLISPNKYEYKSDDEVFKVIHSSPRIPLHQLRCRNP